MNNIPRIGDKIINNRIIRQDNSHQSANPDGIAETPSPEKPGDTPLAEQKEYSLAQFKKDYKKSR